MKCVKPFLTTGGAFGCGQCISCRINKRRVWVTRLTLEAAQYADRDKCFVTLTYDPEHVPSDGNLDKTHVQGFLKRLRHTQPKIRFFAVGEYGDQTLRPHYHLALFGYPLCHHLNTRIGKDRDSCCPPCDTLRKKWGMGQTFIGTLSGESLAYTCGYIVKKLNGKKLKDRTPEFALMSRKPGIGFDFAHEIASEVLRGSIIPKLGDVPSVLRTNGKLHPLGMAMRRKIRHASGLPPQASPLTLAKQAEDLQILREIAVSTETPLSQVVMTSLGNLEGSLLENINRKSKL